MFEIRLLLICYLSIPFVILDYFVLANRLIYSTVKTLTWHSVVLLNTRFHVVCLAGIMLYLVELEQPFIWGFKSLTKIPFDFMEFRLQTLCLLSFNEVPFFFLIFWSSVYSEFYIFFSIFTPTDNYKKYCFLKLEFWFILIYLFL